MIMDLIYQKLGKLNSMMKRRSILSFLLVFFVSITGLNAQNVFTTCSGAPFSYSNESGYVPGETYTWTVASSTGSITGQIAGTGLSIDQTLINALNSSGTVTYNVVTTAPSAFTLVVTVNPKATITNVGSFVSPICSGITQNFLATSSVPGTNIVWTRGAIPGINNPGNTGTFLENETLTNATANPITVPYTFTLTTVSNCITTTTINAVVNPIPSLNTSLTLPAICNGDLFTYTPSSSTPGATYKWTRAPIANNSLATGTGNVSELLFNNTNTGILVQYTYETSISTACPFNQIVTVPVNPIPNIADQTITPICSNGSFILNPAGAPTGTQYTWSIPTFTPAVTGASAGTNANSISQSLINSSPSTNATGTYVVTPKTGSCTGTPFNVNVTVNAGGSLLSIPSQPFLACNNTPFNFPIAGPTNTTYTWGAPSGTLIGGVASSAPTTGFISGTLINNSVAPATAIYDVVPQLNGCTGSIFQVEVTVDNPAILSGSLTPPAVCSGQPFIYRAASTSPSIFTWERNIVAGITNSYATNVGDINEVLINTTALPITVNYIYTLQTGNCTNQQIVSVVVNPIPVLNSATPNPICSGLLFNYTPTSATPGTAYQWNRPFITSISNINASGINNPSEMLVNTSINSVLVGYNYTLIANGCNNTQTVNVIVKPIPIVTNQIANICSGAQFTVTPSPVPAGTQYTWTNPTINPTNSILDGLAQGSPQTTISAIINNFTPNPASAKYIVTPTVNGCTGSTFSVDVNVTAITGLTSTLTPPTICSGQPFSYAPSTNTLGTIIGWTRGPVKGILEAAASGTGNPLEVLTNNSTGIVTVPYLFTLTTPTGCVSTQIVNAKVYPAPVLSSQLVATPICTGTIFNYTPLSTSLGATFSWIRPAIPGMSNAPGSGSGLNYPVEQLDNVSTTPKTVTYNFTINVNGCTNTQAVTVIVNPKPVVPNQTALTCSNVFFNVIPTGVILGTQYTWTLPTSNSGSISGGSAQPILQDSISQLLGNTTINNATATYTVTPFAYGCQGSDFTLIVTVRPEPIVANQIIAPVCSNTAFSYAAGAVPLGTTYTWSNPLVSPTNSLSGGSPQAFNQTLVSQTLTSSNNLVDTAIYTVTPSSGGCVGATFNLTVPVKPVPFVNNLFDTVCSKTAFLVSPGNVPLNTTYTWTNPTSIPFGRVVGGSGNNVPVNAISQTPTNTGGTPAQLLYTITPFTNGCTGNSFTLLETVGVLLPPIANTTATVCSSVPFNATPTGVPVNTKYTWAVQSITPAGTIAGTRAQNLAQATVSDTIANISSALATAVYAVTPSNTGCVGNVFLATINVRPIPKATITAPATVCAYINDTLSVSFAGTGPWSFNYLDNGVAKTQTGITTNPYTWIVPTPLLATTKSLVITRVSDFACVDSVSNTTINQILNPLPQGHIVNLHGQYICNNTLDTLFIGHTLDTLSFQWTLNGIPMPNMNTDSISTLVPGRYNAYFTNKYGCSDTAAIPETLTYISQPVLKFSFDNYCINSLINFKNLTDTTYTGPTSFLWDMGDSTTRNRFDAAVTYPTAGRRKIQLTAFQFYCPAYTTTLDSVINIEFPTPGIRMPSVSAYLGQNTPIIGRNLPTYRYNWSPAWGIDYPDSSSVNFNYQKTQEYLFQLIALSGCVTSDTVLVRVFDNSLVNILVPKSFTPNGDGINDKLFPYLTGIKTFQYYKVYNRFGKLMFETRNYDEGWDGSVGGTPQPMAIYIWVAAGIGTDGTLVEKRGETLLLR
jgi:gliding motility-associated-like protein